VRQPDITRARQVLGWEPEVELDEGLRRLLASADQTQVLAKRTSAAVAS
jgi:nucleoside-diphosphate-sugar epimerase